MTQQMMENQSTQGTGDKTRGVLLKDYGNGKVRVIYADGSKKVISKNRYVWESEKGQVPEGYVVALKDFSQPVTIQNLVLQHQEPDVKLICVVCSKAFERNYRRHENNIKNNIPGPFCSRHCAKLGLWKERRTGL